MFSRDGPPKPRAFALTFKQSNRHWERGDRTPPRSCFGIAECY